MVGKVGRTRITQGLRTARVLPGVGGSPAITDVVEPLFGRRKAAALVAAITRLTKIDSVNGGTRPPAQQIGTYPPRGSAA